MNASTWADWIGVANAALVVLAGVANILTTKQNRKHTEEITAAQTSQIIRNLPK